MIRYFFGTHSTTIYSLEEGVLEILRIGYGIKKRIHDFERKNFLTYMVYIVRGRVSLFRKSMFVIIFVVYISKDLYAYEHQRMCIQI